MQNPVSRVFWNVYRTFRNSTALNHHTNRINVRVWKFQLPHDFVCVHHYLITTLFFCYFILLFLCWFISWKNILFIFIKILYVYVYIFLKFELHDHRKRKTIYLCQQIFFFVIQITFYPLRRTQMLAPKITYLFIQ